MRFSIIVPCYNVSAYIQRCIDSILQQSYKDYELIAINDGSTDDTLNILREYAARDERIRIIDKANGGITSARKSGVVSAVGEYLIFIDGDDWIETEYLYNFNLALMDSPVDVVVCGYNDCCAGCKESHRVTIDGRCGHFTRNEVHNYVIDRNLFRFPPQLWAKAFRRELCMRYQMEVDDSIQMGEDGIITYSCIYHSDSVCVIDYIGYDYRLTSGSLTRSRKKYIPFQNAEWRVEYLERHIGCDDRMMKQIAAYAVHAYFNSAVTTMNRFPYSEARRMLNERLSDSHIRARITKGKELASFKERLARIILLRRIYPLIKLWGTM